MSDVRPIRRAIVQYTPDYEGDPTEDLGVVYRDVDGRGRPCLCVVWLHTDYDPGEDHDEEAKGPYHETDPVVVRGGRYIHADHDVLLKTVRRLGPHPVPKLAFGRLYEDAVACVERWRTPEP